MLILGGIGLLTIVIIVFCNLYYRKCFSLPYGILRFPCVKFTREVNTVDEIEAVEMHEIQTNAAEVQCERILYVTPEGEKSWWTFHLRGDGGMYKYVVLVLYFINHK